jgi:alkylation response protein AidB-like acyl-CoA dehydrogenase
MSTRAAIANSAGRGVRVEAKGAEPGPMSFDLSTEQQEIKAAVLAFARDQLGGDLREDERAGVFSVRKWQAAASFGLLGLSVPEEYGGANRDLLTTVCAMEALGQGCPDSGLIFSMNAHVWSAVTPILRFGTPEQKARYLPPLVDGRMIGVQAMTEEGSGSDAFNVGTTALRQGGAYVLRGAKVFVTNAPVADLLVVFATVDRSAGPDGITAFLVEKGMPGLSVGASLGKMGLRTSPLGEVFLDGCVVPEGQRLGPEGAGVAIFNHSMDAERACILAANVGVLERQLASCVARARTWKRFGRPIGKFQSVSNRIAEMKVRLETARLVLYRAAWLRSRGQRSTLESAIAKLYISECLVASGLDAVQIFGGYGYMAEYGVERDLRDAVGSTLYSGTSDIQRLIIARCLGL